MKVVDLRVTRAARQFGAVLKQGSRPRAPRDAAPVALVIGQLPLGDKAVAVAPSGAARWREYQAWQAWRELQVSKLREDVLAAQRAEAERRRQEAARLHAEARAGFVRAWLATALWSRRRRRRAWRVARSRLLLMRQRVEAARVIARRRIS